jgi:hypothetical protein
MHTHDAVFWGVVISVVGSAIVLAWLFFMLVRNARRSNSNSKT